jgi:calcineurin-like phosphoesterase family protein
LNVYLISDTHLNHTNIATYCDRPADFTERILEYWKKTVRPEDLVIHLGDVILDKKNEIEIILKSLPGRKVLVRGNHDRQWSCDRWMVAGFDFACDGLKFRNCWLTHEPSTSLADGCRLNIHGHLHNIWHGFHVRNVDGDKIERGSTLPPTKLRHEWQRLLAIEYTGFFPVEFDKFVDHPKKYLATGLGD